MQRLLSAILAIGMLFSSPLSALAVENTPGKAGQITVEDSIAGLGADIALQGFDAFSSYSLTVLPPIGQAITLQAQTDAQGNSLTSLRPEETEHAGRYRVTANRGGVRAGAEATFSVLPDSPDVRNADVRADRDSIDDDGSDEALITVTLRDRFGNALAGRPVTLVSSRSADQLYALSQETDVSGAQEFVLASDEPGYAVIRAIDLLSGQTLSQSVEVQVGSAMGNEDRVAYQDSRSAGGKRMYGAALVTGDEYDVIDHFEIDAPAQMVAGVEAPALTITAVDRSGNIVRSYVGTVVFSSTDPDAQLPNFGRYAFKDRDQGEKEFALGLKFLLGGTQTLRVEDQNDPRIFGEADIDVSGRGTSADKMIVVESPVNGDKLGKPAVTVKGKGPRFVNLQIKAKSGAAPEQTFLSSTDGDGNFEEEMQLVGTGPDFYIDVYHVDDDGTIRAKSESVYVTLDSSAPTLSDVTFDPGSPVEGEQVLVSVKADSDTAGAGMRLTNKQTRVNTDVVLKPNAAAPGTFQEFFTAPEAGEYDALILASDALGNQTQMKAMLTIKSKELTQVRNLRANPLANAVTLEWDAPSDGEEQDIEKYRIYVGEKEGDFAYDFVTDRAVTKATVANLKAGQPYYFAVTALKEDRESEKSDVVSAQALGLTLEVSPQASALKLTWTPLSKDIPLSAYVLEYRVKFEEEEESELAWQGAERRLINAELKTYILRDLIDGIPYAVRLTPLTVTNEELTDLVALGEGTPNGNGFLVGAADPIPFDATSHPGNLHSGAPLTPESGLPRAAGWILVAAFGGAGGLWYRRRIQRQRHAAFLHAMQTRYAR